MPMNKEGIYIVDKKGQFTFLSPRGTQLDLKEQDLDYFTKRLHSSTAKKKKISLNICALKTLRTCFQLMEDETLPRFSLAWMKLGMMQSRRCLTQKISQLQQDLYRKTS